MATRETPIDIVHIVAFYLAAENAFATLAALQRLSTDTYEVVNPLLYHHLTVNARAGQLFTLEGVDSSTSVRRRSSLARVHKLTIRAFPPDSACVSLATTAESVGTALFPRLTSVSLTPFALDQLRVWTPEQYDRPRLPPLLEALAAGARPTRFCAAFRLVPSTEWEAHRDATTDGQHTLARKIAQLCAAWPLRAAAFHDIVHQVLPAIAGTRNVYDFAPHVVPHPSFPGGPGRGRFLFPQGRAAVRLPGPEWSVRPWQAAGAVKSLLPSDADHASIVLGDADADDDGTFWELRGITGGILTKEARDDDDTSGVWYEEAQSLIFNAVSVGLCIDLPERGVPFQVVDEVIGRVTYGDVQRCEACGRAKDEHTVMGLDDIPW